MLEPRLGYQNGSAMEPKSLLDLSTFQLEAVQQATAILERRSGVLIADSVGLGKTFVGLGLVERALQAGRRVIVVVPAALRPMWRRELKKLPGLQAVVVSHTQVALGHAADQSFDLVVVDEAHAFRNPRTRRYRALRLLCRGARTVLITATPVNNALADLYFQLRLFCGDGAFRDLGIGSLRAALTDGRDVTRVLRAVMIRRTRAEARMFVDQPDGSRREGTADQPNPQDQPGGPRLRFPREARMHAVGYGMPMPPPDLARALHSLSFPAYRVDPHAPFSADVLRFAFLKRMESSSQAIRVTLDRQIRFYEQFVPALERGALLRPAAFRSMFAPSDDALQLVLEGVALEAFPHAPPHLLAASRSELHALRSWRRALTGADAKLDQLIRLLAGRPRNSRIIVFTEYRDTARYLWGALRRRFPTALIDGSGAWIGETPASRRQVIESFAPRANGGRAIHPREAVAILIATDVLAEGMNLQDADAVVSYDLPWNPIRLVQRAGRIDRIGSEHDTVHVYNFIPDREFEAFLGLARTIRTKLETVRESVGLERPVLEPDEPFEAVMAAVRAGDARVLDRLEASPEAALRAAWNAQPVGAKVEGTPIAWLPGATGQYILVGLRRGAEWEIERVCVPTGAVARGADVDAVLLSALADRNMVRFEPACFQRVAAGYLAAMARRPEAVARSRLSVGAVAARAIRQRLAELPFEGGGAGIYERADVILETLSHDDADDAEDEIRRILAQRDASLEETLEAIEAALSRNRIRAVQMPPWTLTGVIVAD